MLGAGLSLDGDCGNRASCLGSRLRGGALHAAAVVFGLVCYPVDFLKLSIEVY